ncbi:MAG: hypothetical protein RLZZ165_1118 [Bacteroidota bacterium]|jgi:hypothetical protein
MPRRRNLRTATYMGQAVTIIDHRPASEKPRERSCRGFSFRRDNHRSFPGRICISSKESLGR